MRRSLAAASLAVGKPKPALVEADAALARRPFDPVTLSVRAEISPRSAAPATRQKTALRHVAVAWRQGGVRAGAELGVRR